MVGVLVDACGWVALVEARIHLDIPLEEVVGPFELQVTEGVIAELERLETQKGRALLLDLLRARAVVVGTPADAKHTDDALLSLAIANKTPVLTVDKTLKRRLHEANASVIEVLASRTLRFIE